MADLHTTLLHLDIVHNEPVQVSPLVRRITANNASIYTGPGTNTYVVGRERFSVIDPGPNDSAHVEAILQATGGKIDRVIATHAHEDHSPAALPLVEATGAVMMGMANDIELEYIDTTFEPTEILADGQLIDGGDHRLRAIHTPGHLQAHCCILQEEDSMLFAGDHVMQGASVVIIPSHGGTMWEYLASLKKLQGQGINYLAPAHGHILTDVDQVLQELYDHRMSRERKILKALTQLKTSTVEQLTPLVYPDVSGDLIKGAHFALLGHMLKLEHDGVAVKRHSKHWIMGEETWSLLES